ncbi:MAG TPA: cell division protein FtsZ [Candidatus Saccharimonadales bacterium]|nr:cell division protein FtsZ [Candidatus Saccharimonadales bacterium]
MAEIIPEVQTFARIKVVGVGGAGSAAIERMITSRVQGVEFVVVNTDAQALHYSSAPRKVHIGKETTRGLGSGSDPAVGRKAAEESEADIYEMLKGADMVFIPIGAGGGTGSGAGPFIAGAAKELGALVVGIATKPFTFEGERRRRNADVAIDELKDNVDTLITIPNDRLLQMIDRKTSLMDAFHVVDEVLQQGVQGISDLITIHGLINLDFADIKAIMTDAGSSLMGIGKAGGENRAIQAARQAIDSPLLEVSVEGAKGVLFNITGGRNMTMHEIDEAAKTITDAVDPEANIIFGAVLDETLDDDIKITVVATGFAGHIKSTPETAETEPLFEPDVITEARQPFINERPQGFGEPIPAEVEEPEVQPEPARRSALASIEPEPDPSELDTTMSVDQAIKSADKPVEAKSSVVADVSSLNLEDDDLDVPAFIRRKVE